MRPVKPLWPTWTARFFPETLSSILTAARQRRYPQPDCSAVIFRDAALSAGLRRAPVVDEVAELVAAGDAELG